MIERILVPLDGSDVAEQALPHAAALARTFDATVLLSRVPEPLLVPVMSAGVWITRTVESEEAFEKALEYLDEVASRDVLGGLRVETRRPSYPVVHGLLNSIREDSVDLVVMTTHGHTGPDRWVFGSVADKLVQVAPVPVFVVRAKRDPEQDVAIRRIVVPLDGSPLAERALPAAEALAVSTGSSILLVRIPIVPGYLTVVPETAGWIPEQLSESAVASEAYLAEQAVKLRANGLQVDEEVQVVTGGTVADGILAESKKYGADVIVISSHGRSGIGRWIFGSVATRVLHGAECAVWVVREDTK
jgi:nucleotide-binding universal stress UspA family protein